MLWSGDSEGGVVVCMGCKVGSEVCIPMVEGIVWVRCVERDGESVTRCNVPVVTVHVEGAVPDMTCASRTWWCGWWYVGRCGAVGVV